jgi:Ca2+-transporting ATPase
MQKPSHSIYSLEIDEALRDFQTTHDGLTVHEAGKRLAQFGPNSLPVHKTSLLKRLIEPFASVFVGVLLLACALSLLEQRLFDAIIIGVVVVVNALIYYVQQISVNRAMQTLRDHDVTTVPVIRDGQTVRLPSEQLTYGDVVHISEGLKIPADGRLIVANQLECDEAILTGESLPVRKHAAAISGEQPIYAQHNMLFKGTYAKSGTGLLLITGIGADTQLGNISALAGQADTGKSPIEYKIDRLVQQLIIIIGAVAVALLILSLYRGIALTDAVRFALAIVVSAVPEGLPVALTIVLMLSARRMTKVNALVKKISSIETMGAITLIATDKTGTITQNQLAVVDKHTTHPNVATFDQVVRASLNNHGDHMNDSLDEILLQSVEHAHLPASWEKARDYPFDQNLRLSGTLWHREHDYLLITKGAPEAILDYCGHTHRKDTTTLRTLTDFTNKGYRTIAFAHKTFTREPTELSHHLLEHLGLDGFVGMSDQIRPDVKRAVNEAHNAGIKVVMLTGDHIGTAAFIAEQVGIAHHKQEVADSKLLASGNPDDIRDALQHIRVFGRVLPEHKYALLKATKGHEITAMTGDGVNDIPALVEADAGIAMGSSSDAAKDSSDIVLLDDNFHTIVAAVRVGRTALANIRKMIMYLLGTSSGEVLIMLTALALGSSLPVAAVQILWVNLVTDGFTIIPLGLSSGEERQMLVSPRSPRSPLLNLRQTTRVLVMGVVMAAGVLAVYYYYLPMGQTYAQTLAFLSLVVVQWANSLNANLEYRSWVYNFIRPNGKLLLAIGASALLQLLVFMTPVGVMLDIAPLRWQDALVAVAGPSLAVLIAVDLHKLIFRTVRHRKES